MPLQPHYLAEGMARRGMDERQIADAFALILGLPPLSDDALAELGPMPRLGDHDPTRKYEAAEEQALWDEAQDNASQDRAERFNEHTEDVP